VCAQRGKRRDPTDALSADVPGQTPNRALLFRWQGQDRILLGAHGEPQPAHRLAVIPKPEKRTTWSVLHGAGRTGRQGHRRSPSQTSRVTNDCKAPAQPKEERVAANMTIGETDASRQGAKVVDSSARGSSPASNAQRIRRQRRHLRSVRGGMWDRKVVLIHAFGAVSSASSSPTAIPRSLHPTRP